MLVLVVVVVVVVVVAVPPLLNLFCLFARVRKTPPEPTRAEPEGFRATGRCGSKLQILVLATQRRSLTQFQGRRVDLQFLTDNSLQNKVEKKRDDPLYI